MKKIVLVICLIYGIPNHSQVTYNFIANSGNWSNPSNWDINLIPGSTNTYETINIPAGKEVYLDISVIDNNGTMNVHGSLVVFNGITLINNGTIENENSITNDGTIINNSALNNNGAIYSIAFINRGTFTNNKRFYFTGFGTGYVINTGSIKGTNISHTGTFTNDGILSPGNSIGLYTLDDDYSHEPSANLNIEIEESTTPGTDYDKITINGNASIDGTLTTTLVNGFEPEIGDSFTILTANSVSGTFSTLNMPTHTDKVWSVTYNSDSVVLTVNSSLSTTNFEENAESLLYPNPAHNILHIKSNSQISKLDIYNELGQIVLSNEYKTSIDVSRLYSGLYYISITNNNGINETKKFIKK